MNLKKLIWLVVWIGLGVGFGMAFVWYLPRLPLSPRQNVNKLFHINRPVIMGFVPYWLVNKVSEKSLKSLNEVTYFGLEINVDGSLVKKNNPRENEPGWQTLNTNKFSELMKKVPNYEIDKSLLLHLSNEASISALLSNPEVNAIKMISEAKPLMVKYGFTDLNIDVESFKLASPSAQASMIQFLQAAKNQMIAENLGTLTVELTVASLIKSHLMVPEQVGKIADRVVLMAYDYRYRGSYIAGPAAPTLGAADKWGYDINESLKLITAVIPAAKIILGIPLYGYEWETLTSDPEGVIIPGTGKTATMINVEDTIKNCTNCIIKREELSKTPLIILPPNDDSAYQQIYFEDKTSIAGKINLAREFRLGGIAFWALGYETEDLLSPELYGALTTAEE